MYKRWAPAGDKRQARYWLKLLKKVKTWQLVLILILLVFIAATFLRLNNLGMVERRVAVMSADKEGQSQQTKQAIVELQHYTSAHMNTSLGNGIVLQQTYLRDYEKALSEALEAPNQNSSVYQQASIDCQARFQGSVASFRNDYVTCVENAVASLPADQQKEAHLPQLASYRYNFISPLISFDLAGIFVLACLFVTSVIIGRLCILYSLKLVLRRRNKMY